MVLTLVLLMGIIGTVILILSAGPRPPDRRR